jgi:hypothetical protein
MFACKSGLKTDQVAAAAYLAIQLGKPSCEKLSLILNGESEETTQKLFDLLSNNYSQNVARWLALNATALTQKIIRFA